MVSAPGAVLAKLFFLVTYKYESKKNTLQIPAKEKE
jgi:hypothetical protein